MEGRSALQELMLLERQRLSSVFCRSSLTAEEWWYRGWGGLFPTPLQRSSLLSESLQACFFLSLPITFSLSLFQAGLLLPADFSQPSANLLIFSLVHLRFLWSSPPHIPLPQFLRVSKWRGVRCTLKEGRKHPERPMMSLAHPVPMTAGKCVFRPSFHRETRSSWSESFAARSQQIIFQRFTI